MTDKYLDPWKFNNWPDCVDSGKKIDATLDGGKVILNGTLITEDFGFDGEDEYPIFVIEDKQGNRVSFTCVAKYRFV